MTRQVLETQTRRKAPTRGDFVRDEFEVDYFSQSRKSTSFKGHVVSTGEPFVTRDEGIIISGGLSRRRQLLEEKRLVGHRFPVWYLPPKPFWSLVDKINHFRVVSPEEFSASDKERVVWLGIGAAFWVTGFLLFGWGVVIATRARHESDRIHKIRNP